MEKDTKLAPVASDAGARLLRHAESLFAAGETTRAATLLDSALASVAPDERDVAVRETALWSGIGLADLHARLDDVDAAEEALARARSLVGGDGRLGAAVAVAEAGLALALGAFERASGLLAPLAAAGGFGAPAAALGLARVAAFEGRLDEAEAHLAAAGDEVPEAPLRPWLSPALVAAHLALLRDELERAERLLTAAAGRPGEDPAAVALGRARLQRVRWSRRHEARELLLGVRAVEVALGQARGRLPAVAREALLHRAAARALTGDGGVAAGDARRALAGYLDREGSPTRLLALPEWPLARLLADAILALEAGGDPGASAVHVWAAALGRSPDLLRLVAPAAGPQPEAERAPPTAPPQEALSPCDVAPLAGARSIAEGEAALVAAVARRPGIASARVATLATAPDLEGLACPLPGGERALLVTPAPDPHVAPGIEALLEVHAAVAARITRELQERAALRDVLRSRERAVTATRRARGGEAGRTVVASDPAMRALVERLRAAARLDPPLVLVGERGVGLTFLSHALVRWRPPGAGRVIGAGALADRVVAEGARATALALRATRGTVVLDDADRIPAGLWEALVATRSAARGPGARFVLTVHDEAAAAPLRARIAAVAGASALRVAVPPLRTRPADIPVLVEGLLRRVGTGGGKVEVSSGAMALLIAHAWPGNVSELDVALQRAVALAGGSVQPAHVAEALRADPSASWLIGLAGECGYHGAVRETRRRLVQEALREAGGHRTHAAALLGLQRTYFARLLRELEVEAPEVDGRQKRAAPVAESL